MQSGLPAFLLRHRLMSTARCLSLIPAIIVFVASPLMASSQQLLALVLLATAMVLARLRVLRRRALSSLATLACCTRLNMAATSSVLLFRCESLTYIVLDVAYAGTYRLFGLVSAY